MGPWANLVRLPAWGAGDPSVDMIPKNGISPPGIQISVAPFYYKTKNKMKKIDLY